MSGENYVCTLTGTVKGNAITLDFNGTWDLGGGPRLSIVDEDVTMDAPMDSDGNFQDVKMRLGYSKARVLIAGQFTDGWGNLSWTSPTTKAEKLIALQKIPEGDVLLTWPVAGKVLPVKFDRLDIREQAAGGNTIAYDVSLQIIGQD